MDRSVADIVHLISCGLDVHVAVIFACLVRTGSQGGPQYEERQFPSTLRGLRELRDRLVQAGCTCVGMEATGVYWIPVYAVLEGHIPTVVGNPNHIPPRPQDRPQGCQVDRRPHPARSDQAQLRPPGRVL
jgi:transposase